MSLRLNIAANYVSQLYVTVLGIAVMPLYIHYIGAETYGLIGFFAMLQVWFGLLDVGLTPTISRETARFFGGTLSVHTFRMIFRVLSVLFFVIAVSGGLFLFLSSSWIADNWLHLELLSLAEVTLALEIMAISIAMRWLCGLYRGVVIGAENLVWLSCYNAMIATLRFPAVFVSMVVFGFTAKVFFVHQLAVATMELAGLSWRAYRLLPSKVSANRCLGWSLRPVLPLLRFSITIAITSAVWVFVTQMDKLVLSGILPLSTYGYFSLAVLVAGGITLIISPISLALMPRLARLFAERNESDFIAIYRQATRLVAVIAAWATFSLIICAEPVLIAWTGDSVLAREAAPILQLYAAGNGLLAFGAFPFYLQYARGNLRYHLIGNAILIALLLPSVIVVAELFGAIGAGWIWLSVNVLYLFGWVAYVHHRLEPGLHCQWVVEDILKYVAGPALFAVLLEWVPFESTSRIYNLVFCMLVGLVLLLPSLFAARHLYRQSLLFGSTKTPVPNPSL